MKDMDKRTILIIAAVLGLLAALVKLYVEVKE